MKAIKQRSVDLLGENVTPGQGLPQERGQILQKEREGVTSATHGAAAADQPERPRHSNSKNVFPAASSSLHSCASLFIYLLP